MKTIIDGHEMEVPAHLMSEKPRIEKGTICRVTHSRKGEFILQIIDDSDEWIQGTIINGIADAILDYNVKYPGEEIALRKAFCTIEVLPNVVPMASA